jgi:hypothetical protein
VNEFWQSPVYRIVRGMRACGNQPGMVARWIFSVEEWARRNSNNPDAKSVIHMLPHWQARPFYTAAELAPLIPALAVAFNISAVPPPVMSGARLSFALDYAGLPKLKNANGTEWFHDGAGILQRYYIVEHIHHWAKETLTQEEFENVLFA